MNEVLIRPATAQDAEAIASIYNHYVRSSTATFETVERDAAHRREWLVSHGADHPVIVAEREGSVAGWAALSPWAGRPGWRYTVEVAVYVEQERTGDGIGPVLLEQIVKLGREAGFHALVAQIVSDNRPSLAMVERAGFTEVGRMIEVGRKFDRWLDVVLVEKVVGEAV